MNKKFIVKQCRRLEVTHQEESENLKDDANNQWLIIHNQGHTKLINEFESFLKNANNNDKKIVKNWLKYNIKKANKIIKTLDVKYNHFENDEIMSWEDNISYFVSDGIICMAYTLINIINGKRYICKVEQGK